MVIGIFDASLPRMSGEHFYNKTLNRTMELITENMTYTADGFHVNLDQHHDVPIQAKSYSLYKTAMSFNLYYPPILIATGLLGNSLSFLVMLQRTNRKFSCCVYLAGLAVADNLFMCNALHLWLMTAIFPAKFTDKHCTFVAFSFQVNILLFIII